MKTLALALAASTMAVTGTMAVPLDQAEARDRYRDRDDRYRDRVERRYYQRDGVRYWRGRDGRNYCKRSDGTVGLIVGGAAGALAGRAIDTEGDRTLGTLAGAAAGALLGREVDKGSKISCR